MTVQKKKIKEEDEEPSGWQVDRVGSEVFKYILEVAHPGGNLFEFPSTSGQVKELSV